MTLSEPKRKSEGGGSLFKLDTASGAVFWLADIENNCVVLQADLTKETTITIILKADEATEFAALLNLAALKASKGTK